MALRISTQSSTAERIMLSSMWGFVRLSLDIPLQVITGPQLNRSPLDDVTMASPDSFMTSSDSFKTPVSVNQFYSSLSAMTTYLLTCSPNWTD